MYVMSSVYDVQIGSGAAALGIIVCFLTNFLAQSFGGVCRRMLWMRKLMWVQKAKL